VEVVVVVGQQGHSRQVDRRGHMLRDSRHHKL
jgi:hypothetical protein